MSNHQQRSTTRKLWHVSFNSLCWECLEKDNNDDDVGGHDYVYMPIIMKMIGNTLSCSKVLNLSLDITLLINWFFIKDVPGCCSRSARPDWDEEPLEKRHCRRLRWPPCSCPPPPHCAALPESWNWTDFQVVLCQKPRKTQDDQRCSSATKQLLIPEGWYFSFSISKVFPSGFFIMSSDHLRKTKRWC